MYIAPETLATGSETVTVEARGQRIAHLATGDLARAAALLAECERDLLGRLGVDPAAAAVPVRARVRGDCERWIIADDYPTEALRAGEQGRVGVRLDLDAYGVVVGCTPVLKSGHASLDSGTCGPLITRARYYPARDAAGAAVPSSQLFFTNWLLP